MRILDVGQCGVDGPEIAMLLHDRLGAKVDSAATADDARRKLRERDYNLVLVNRVFAADGSSGVDVIEEFTQQSEAPVMLVSDRSDAQKAAIERGAVPGFGKAELDDPKTFDLIKRAATGSSK